MGTESSPQLPAQGRARWPRVTLSSRAHPGPSPRGLGEAQHSLSLPGPTESPPRSPPPIPPPGLPDSESVGARPAHAADAREVSPEPGAKLWAPTPAPATPCAPASSVWNRQTSENAAGASAIPARLGARRHIFNLDDTWEQSQENLCAQLRESCWSQSQAYRSSSGA